VGWLHVGTGQPLTGGPANRHTCDDQRPTELLEDATSRQRENHDRSVECAVVSEDTS